MGKVVAQANMSLDGYVAKQDNTIGRLFDWLQNGDLAYESPAGDIALHLSQPSADHVKRWVGSLGALVCGPEPCSTWPTAGTGGTPSISPSWS